jgi:hypothetical protein
VTGRAVASYGNGGTMTFRSPLARIQQTKIDYERIKREAWLDDGILVVAVEEVPDISWPDRQHLRNIGNRLYGRRAKTGSSHIVSTDDPDRR